MTASEPPATARRPIVVWSLFAILFFAWMGWIIYSLRHVAPGLLDDGIHMLAAKAFETDGFLKHTFGDLHDVRHGARFYETQFCYLGVCWAIFHRHLTGWYVANFLLNAICALSAFALIYKASRNKIGAALAAAMILTSSPVAETIRAGFGKAEAVMGMFFVAGLCVWGVFVSDRKSRLALVFSALLIVLGCVSKESGNILALSIIIPSLLVLLFRIRTTRPIHSLGVIGIVGYAANYLVFLPSKRAAYIGHYFELDFSWVKVKASFLFYLREMPDIALMLVAAVLIYAFVLCKSWRKLRSENDGSQLDYGYLALGASLLAFAAAYLAALLGFRFTLIYYIYIPLALLAVGTGIGFVFLHRISPKASAAVLAVFFITRVYSVGYLYCMTGVQRLFDETDFAAFQNARTFGANRLFVLDIPEESQAIQEWNCLRIALDEPRVPMLYGAFPNFAAWTYQDHYRTPASDEIDSSAARNATEPHSAKPGWYTRVPKVGDLVACRYGKIVVGDHYLRSGLPFTGSPNSYLATLDTDALSEAGQSQHKAEIFNPNTFHTVKAKYGWRFFRVNKPLAYRVVGVSAGWIRPDTTIEIFETLNCHHIQLEVEASAWQKGFPMRLSAISDGQSLAAITFEQPGIQTLDIPVTKEGRIEFSTVRAAESKTAASHPPRFVLLQSHSSL